MHVHVNVTDLASSVRYYTTLFGSEPTRLEPEYAKWMLEDPRVNFAISQQGRTPGLDHLGIQAESRDELDAIAARLAAADVETLAQEGTTCCYAKSDKAWSEDPSGIKWESFHSFGDATVYGESAPREGSACCTPRAGVAAAASCCAPSADRPATGCCS
jgi:hypothetical protein